MGGLCKVNSILKGITQASYKLWIGAGETDISAIGRIKL